VAQEDLLSRFERVAKSRGGWSARCPAHDDRDSSLFIRQDAEVNWHLECRAGCTTEKMADVLGIALSELSPEQLVRYDYDGFYEVVRIGEKDLRERRPDGDGWTFDMMGVEPRLYRLEKLEKASLGHGRSAIVVEGEEYVNRLWNAVGDQMPATCVTGGLGNWAATHVEQLKAAGVWQVAVIPDSDPESRAHAHEVAYACHAAGLSVRTIELPDAVNNVSDYIGAGYRGNDLVALIEAAPWVTGPLPTRLSEVKPEPVSWLWPGWISVGTVVVLEGNPGVGKTLLALDLAARVSAGRTMPDGRSGLSEPAGVVLVTGDDLSRTVRPRLDVMGADVTRIQHLPRDGHRLPTDADLASIRVTIGAAAAKFVVVAPLLPVLSSGAASCTDQALRNALAKLARLAARTRTAILVTRDLDNGAAGNTRDRGAGLGNVSGVSTRLIAGPDPDDAQQSVLRRIASDPSTEGAEFVQFRMVVTDAGVRSITWNAPPNAPAPSRRVARSGRQGPSALGVASDFLRKLLADGAVPAGEVVDAATAAGIRMATLKRAKHLLEVESEKLGQPGSDAQAWIWRLPRR
jgi:hypothetical protein